MADRRAFLDQLQQQLGAWTDWVRQLDDQASSAAAQLREDAKSTYGKRADEVRELIRQGRGQWDRVAGSADDVWQEISGGAEQAWNALQDAAAGLAMQTLPAANEATTQPAVKRKSARSRRQPAKALARKRPIARKKAATRSKKKAKPARQARKPARKATRKSAARSVSRKVRAAAKTRKPARKKATRKK